MTAPQQSPVISRSRPDHISLDFDLLRAEGIRHLENMATELWTDFNAHDPGITILEVLCYALTDLAYRTRMIPIEDLAAGDGRRRAFYEADDILAVRPVTLNDYRKLLIDVEGVKNAWLMRSDAEQIVFDNVWMISAEGPNIDNILSEIIAVLVQHGEIKDGGSLSDDDKRKAMQYYDCIKLLLDGQAIPSPASITMVNSGEVMEYMVVRMLKNILCKYLRKTLYWPGDHTLNKETESQKPINGLYDVVLDLDDAVSPRNINPAEGITQAALNRLHANRGLCQDFRAPKLLYKRPVCICLQMEVDETTDVIEAAAELLYRFQEHLTPTIRFYNFAQMRAKGYRSDEIFNGPLLNNGFIEDAELNASTLPRTTVYYNELVDIATKIPGVVSVSTVKMKRREDVDYSSDETWRFDLMEEGLPPTDTLFKLAIDPLCSNIFVRRGARDYEIAGEKLNESLQNLRWIRDYNPGGDPGKPGGFSGHYRHDLQEYWSVQYEFPAIYGVGNYSAPSAVRTGQSSQSLQLQAYLLFFDQLLAGYLARLGTVRDLFSVDQQPDEKAPFWKALLQTPGVRELMSPYAHVRFEALDWTVAQADIDVYVGQAQREIEQWQEQLAQVPEEQRAGIQAQIDYLNDRIAEYHQAAQNLQALVDTSYPGLDKVKTAVEQALGATVFELVGEAALSRIWERFMADENNNLIREITAIDQPPARYSQQRDRLLNHLLSRFGETFSDYAASFMRADIAPEDNPWQQDFAEYLRDKATFLSTLPELGAERALGYNYRKLNPTNGQPEVWNTPNVSGLQKRVCRLLGIDSYQTRSIIEEPPYIIDLVPYPSKTASPQYALALNPNPGIDYDQQPMTARRKPLLISKKYKSKEDAVKARTELYATLDDQANIFKGGGSSSLRMEEDKREGANRFRVVFTNPEKTHELTSAAMDEKEAERLLLTVSDLFASTGSGDREGFFIIEHVLLRPDDADDELLQLTLGCEPSETPDEPYSFWITVVLPNWLRRFRDADFQQFFEQIFRRETPAHISVRFCWIDRDTMQLFQPKLKTWMEEKARCRPNACNVTEAANELIQFMINKLPCGCACVDGTARKECL